MLLVVDIGFRHHIIMEGLELCQRQFLNAVLDDADELVAAMLVSLIESVHVCHIVILLIPRPVFPS